MSSRLHSPFAEMPSELFQQERQVDVSEEHTVRARLRSDGTVVEVLPDGSTRPMESKTDWERLRNMSEEEIIANTLSDPDNPPLTDEDFKRMRVVPNPIRIREGLRMTQLEFAEAIEIPLATLQKWESDWVLTLDPTVTTLVRAIEQDPEAIRAALAKSHQPVK